jgi:hypothetical protein
MVNISQIVDESLARHRVEPAFDHQRLQWSRWFRCDSSFSVLLAPAKPGIFALAEEMAPAAQNGKRILALFEIKETDDIGMTLGRLFLPGNSLRERLESGKCFVRYTVIEDAHERSAAYEIFRQWLQDSTGTNLYHDVA